MERWYEGLIDHWQFLYKKVDHNMFELYIENQRFNYSQQIPMCADVILKTIFYYYYFI